MLLLAGLEDLGAERAGLLGMGGGRGAYLLHGDGLAGGLDEGELLLVEVLEEVEVEVLAHVAEEAGLGVQRDDAEGVLAAGEADQHGLVSGGGGGGGGERGLGGASYGLGRRAETYA